jgi:hypothetical protein
MIAIARGLSVVQTHYTGEKRDLLRVLLNAESAAEADIAMHILSDSMAEKDLLSAVNIREALRELPACPFAMATDTLTLARVAELERDGSAWRRDFADAGGSFTVTVLGDGNLCYDVILSVGGRNVFWTPRPANGVIIHPDALDLAMEHETLLQRIVDLVMAMGIPFSPTFYLSLEDWKLEYAADAMRELGELF